MKIISPQNPPVFNLLSIGQRGVGKTVFLAGSYAQQLNQSNSSLWLECLDHRDRENLEGILGYVAQKGQYPPATLKITDFNFSLKQKTWQGVKNLCYFHWWDLPGEVCDFSHPDFQKLVLSSHGCCIFINGADLIQDPNYAKELESIVKQVISIASLVGHSGEEYPFALIFTQCDRLVANPIGQLQIEEYLPLLISSLERAGAKFRRFYTAIPIVSKQDNFCFQPSGAVEPLLWIASELSHQPIVQNLETTLQKNTNKVQPVSPQTNRPTRLLTKAILSLVGLAGVAALAITFLTPTQLPSFSDTKIQEYLNTLQSQPNDLKTLADLSTRYIELGKIEQAIIVMEKIVRQKPQDLEWQLLLARLYKMDEKPDKAEQIYDRILAQNPNNLDALIDKATLRQEQGDIETARQLLQQAEKVAPSNLKAKIRSMANRQ